MEFISFVPMPSNIRSAASPLPCIDPYVEATNCPFLRDSWGVPLEFNASFSFLVGGRYAEVTCSFLPNSFSAS